MVMGDMEPDFEVSRVISLAYYSADDLGGGGDYREVLVLRVGPEFHVIRIDIRSDQFVDQSSARVQRFDGNAWQDVHRLLEMNSRVSRNVNEETFEADRNELIRVAGEVLSW